jgi:hypothetical protein
MPWYALTQRALGRSALRSTNASPAILCHGRLPTVPDELTERTEKCPLRVGTISDILGVDMPNPWFEQFYEELVFSGPGIGF